MACLTTNLLSKNSTAAPYLMERHSLSKSGLSGFITRQAAKIMRDKMYEEAEEEE